MDERQTKALQSKLKYKFKDQTLLRTALTHSSYANESKQGSLASNERLEFLGDSILGMSVASLLYGSQPDMPEGRMTRLRAQLVCEKSLASIAAQLQLGDYLLVGRGEEKSGGRKRPSILADAVEALLAAMYLDGGFRPVERFVAEFLGQPAQIGDVESTDYKTVLQEAVQVNHGVALAYKVTGESGPAHMKTYSVVVLLNGSVIGCGTGKTKKEAEQAAARAALQEDSGPE